MEHYFYFSRAFYRKHLSHLSSVTNIKRESVLSAFLHLPIKAKGKRKKGQKNYPPILIEG